jgi:DNA (cytosine-5)-methyltransferase 1
VPADYYLSQGYLDCLKNHREEQRKKGRGYGYYVMRDDSEIPNTLLGGGMGRERNLVEDPNINERSTLHKRKTPINEENIRSLTPREFLRIQGFPEDFRIDVPNTYAYRLIGNSVAIDVVYYIG